MGHNTWEKASDFLKMRALELLGATSFDAEPLVGNVRKASVVRLSGDRSVGLVLGGLLKESIVTRDSREVIVRYVSIGNIYGLLDNSMITVARTAIVMQFERADFESLLVKSPALQAKIIADANMFRTRMVDRLAALVHGSAETKIARALISIAHDCQRTSDESWWCLPYFTHTELAKYSGLARETLTKALLELRRQGVVKIERGSAIFFDYSLLSRW